MRYVKSVQRVNGSALTDEEEDPDEEFEALCILTPGAYVVVFCTGGQ